MRNTKQKRLMGWTTQSAVVLSVTHKDRALQIMCVQIGGTTQWSVVALEAKKVDDGAIPKDVIDGVLDQHRHENLGPVEGLLAAMEVAEAYAARWQRKKVTSGTHEACECTDIDQEEKRTS
jgi:molybdopterin-guanine dinucleotide biosynthesis protein A